MEKKTGAKTKNKESKKVLKRTGKYEPQPHCPVCGWELVWSGAGIWCVNPDCPVLDDYLLYEKDKREEEKRSK